MGDAGSRKPEVVAGCSIFLFFFLFQSFWHSGRPARRGDAAQKKKRSSSRDAASLATATPRITKTKTQGAPTFNQQDPTNQRNKSTCCRLSSACLPPTALQFIHNAKLVLSNAGVLGCAPEDRAGYGRVAAVSVRATVLSVRRTRFPLATVGIGLRGVENGVC